MGAIEKNPKINWFMLIILAVALAILTTFNGCKKDNPAECWQCTGKVNADFKLICEPEEEAAELCDGYYQKASGF